MASLFVFPQTFRSLEQDYDDNRLSVQNPTEVASLSPSQLEEFVKGISFDLSDKDLFCVEEQDIFDRVYSLIRDYKHLSPSCKLNIVESLRSNFSVLLPNIDSLARASPSNDGDAPVLDQIASHRNAFKIYTFFLLHIVNSEEASASSSNNSKVTASTRKKMPKSSWNWEMQRGRILNLIANSLEINISLLFGSSDPDENYLSFVAKNVFSVFENSVLLKDLDTKDALCRIIGACSTKYHFTTQSCASIMHLIHKYDYVVTHMADAVAGAEKKYSDGILAISLIRDVGRTNPKEYVKDTAGAENIGRFLVELAERLPKLFSTNVGLLIPHFGGESYKIRNALVGVLGKLIVKAFCDIEGEQSCKSVRLRSKQAMLEILLERCRDVSAYTRSRVLQVWAELCEEHSVSIGLWNEVAAVAAGRLEDKSAIVRKSALQLLITMLQHNPFGPQLRVVSFEATLEQYKKKLDELEPNKSSENVDGGSPFDDDILNGDGEVDNGHIKGGGGNQQDSLTDSYPQMEEEVVQKDNLTLDVGNTEQIRALVASLEAGLRFSTCISEAMPILVQLMASSSATDVENTILLLMRCRQFQIDGSEACLRKMLPLAFSQDKSIYEAVENAFITIYITKNPTETAKNLLHLAIDSNIGDLAALEFMIDALVSKGDISSSTISALWDFFCFNVGGTTAEQSRGALSVLCMASKSSAGILGSHIQDIIDIGFGRWSKVDPLLARTACIAVQRLSENDKKMLLAGNGSRMFDKLESLITGSWLPEKIWYAAADKAIAAVYSIHPSPEIFAANLVKNSLTSVFNGNKDDELQADIESGNGDILTTKQKAKEKTVVDGQTGHGNGGTVANGEKEDGINAELGLAASEDAIVDSLSEKAEKEIVYGDSRGKNLIGHCAPFLSKLCRNFSLMHKFPDLQASAMLALCRLMIIDADFCQANLQLLFTVVETAPSDIVRSNCTIALGDLAVRFPNLLEPWTENMYARLKDHSNSVRKNAVLVLSHLILNDMMKVKGYINEMTLRLEDDDERISNLAKLFFHELSKKGANPIYNLLPDILGKLCNQNLPRESFCNIMQFLIGSIKRDKQMESLVEKLCNRFSGVSDVRQWEYISYCLSQLGFTEKGMKKLIDSFKTYEHVVSEDSVMEHFKSIINKSKKFAKPELKLCVEEFEEKLNKAHKERKEQEVTARNAEIHQQRIDNIETTSVAVKNEDPTESEITEDENTESSEDGESINDNSEPKFVESEDGTSGELTESETCKTEIQSPQVENEGTSDLRVKRRSSRRRGISS
ncbi:condensin complex subunit 1 [Cucumis melo var. makuwa]|uniref:Condensin-1 complex subunit CAP-D2 n=1 Tax=Cucumis melo var. makuwa TaxID=1194695 RepID=A0A5D3DPE6_CUCMM|nr:condensin complex subunit 1 [Cucumis melo var. makuwa]